MGASTAAVPTVTSRVWLAYTAADGSSRDGALNELWSVSFEYVGPVWASGSFKSRRGFPGLWWLATTGTHVGFGSWLERDNLMLLDFDPEVAAVSSRPFRLSWTAGGKTRRHSPSYFVRMTDGTAVVVDVHAEEPTHKEGAAEAFGVMARACAAVGWQYLRLGTVDAVLAANLRWLAGYRHPRCVNAAHAARLRETLVRPRPLADVIDAVGDGMAVLPSLFHLLWSGAIRADLRTSPLSAATMLTLAAA